MDFFVRIFKSAPSDQTLWEMLNGGAVHFAIDNQAMQIIKTTRFDSADREKALRVSSAYSDYTNNLASIVPTIEVLSQPLHWREEAEEKEEWRAMTLAQDLPAISVKKTERMRYEETDAHDLWIDPMNTQALQHMVYIKNQNDVCSPVNRDYFSFSDVTKNPPKFAVIDGYFNGICTRDTDYGVRRRGLQRIIDPAQIYDHKHDPASVASIALNHPVSTIVTEPGQIQHVLRTYGGLCL